MHANTPRNQRYLGRGKGLIALRNLPDLPPLNQKMATRWHNVWLWRVAVCFVLISVVLMTRSAWAYLGASVP